MTPMRLWSTEVSHSRQIEPPLHRDASEDSHYDKDHERRCAMMIS
jgi:hypothetical protein